MKLMIRLIVLLLAVCGLNITAANLKVVSFAPNPLDLTAAVHPRADMNGVACALIKIVCDGEIKIEGNIIGDIVDDGSEKQACFTSGTKKIIIKKAGYEPLVVNFPEFNEGVDGLQSKMTYELKLKGDIIKQAIVIQYTPTDAEVLINAQRVGSNGVATAILPAGSIYEYIVAASGYEPKNGRITLSPNKAEMITVNLKQAPSKSTSNTFLSKILPNEKNTDRWFEEANALYADGKYDNAVELLKKCSKAGHAEAQLTLGLLYEQGIEVPVSNDSVLIVLKKSYTNAYLLVQKSAYQGLKAAKEEFTRLKYDGDRYGENVNIRYAESWILSAKYKDPKPDLNRVTTDGDKCWEAVEEDPQFPGGQEALLKWISEHLRYPSTCQEKGIQGRVVVQFVVKKDGFIGEVKVVRGKHPDLDAEAVSVIKSMKIKFYPGKMNGYPVNVWYTLPMQFKLQGV